MKEAEDIRQKAEGIRGRFDVCRRFFFGSRRREDAKEGRGDGVPEEGLEAAISHWLRGSLRRVSVCCADRPFIAQNVRLLAGSYNVGDR